MNLKTKRKIKTAGAGSFGQSAERFLPLIEKALDRFLAKASAYPPEVHEAMRYAVLNGGKRFRPILLLASCEAVGGNPRRALLPACAVEMIHAYSLVHDDLPALDNDDIRRGQPTVHRKFGEAIAILAGDGLLTRAFELLAGVKPAEKSVRLIRELSRAAGTQGMIGGQVADILFAKQEFGRSLNLSALDYINRNKTGKLIEASAVLGALLGTDSPSEIQQIRRFGCALGLAFQVVDDIMDGNGYLRIMDFQEAQQKARQLIKKAQQEISSFGPKAKWLRELTQFLADRIPSKDDLSVDVSYQFS